MKRKLVQQGNNGFTISLPKKWILENNLKKGDEVDLLTGDNSISIKCTQDIKKINTISCNSDNEIIFRIKVANSFRKGYDEIHVKTEHFSEQEIEEFTDKYLMGFETIKIADNSFKLEETIISHVEDIDKVILKYVGLQKLIYSHIFNKDISKLIEKIQKYDNLIKRLISKNKNSQNIHYIWSIFSHFLFASREALHLQRKIKKYSIRDEFFESEIEKLSGLVFDFYLSYKEETINLIIEKCQEIFNYLNSYSGNNAYSNSAYTLTKHLYLVSNLIQGHHYE